MLKTEIPGSIHRSSGADPAFFEFRLLGTLSIHVGGKRHRQTIAGPARELLIYLLSHPDRNHRREVLPEAIWGELRAPSRGGFNTILWRLKRFLAELHGPELKCDAIHVRLNLPEGCAIDSRDLLVHAGPLQDLKDTLPDHLRTALRRLTKAWRGPFAEGEPSDWLLEERERIHDAYVRALTALMRDAGVRGRFECALEYCQSILRVDPFRENIHCEMLWLMVLTGQRARAIQSHDAFCKRLRSELEIDPMVETSALFDFIRNDLDKLPAQAATTDRYGAFLKATRDSRAEVYAALRRERPVPSS